MDFIRTEIPDVVVCSPKVHSDGRGYFSETFRQDKLNDFLGFQIDFCQENESRSAKGVLRGLHYQVPPFAQTKLVRVIQGVVLDVAVDIREGSPTFGEHVCVELSSENKRQLLVPRGFAHGFIVCSEYAIFTYKVDNYYAPDCERGLLYNDKELAIDWVLDEKCFSLSAKDYLQPRLSDAQDLFDYQVKNYG